MNRESAAHRSGVVVAVRASVVDVRFGGALPPIHALLRADHNVGEWLQDLHARVHRLRQGGIDEERFEGIAGFDALLPRSSGHR